MSFIGSFAKGEWGKGLAGMFGGSIGETIFETARGNQTIGKAAAQIGTDVASAAISFIPGIGPVAGAALKAGMSAGNAAIQGGTAKDIAIAGVAGGASAAAGSLLGKASSLIKEGAGKVSTHFKGAPTGAAADITTQSATNATAKAPVPNGAPELRPPALRPAATMTKAQTMGAKIIKGGKTVANSKAGKIAGQYGAQGALSVASMAMGAKQANAANEVARQSLLFQQQTYKDQQAEIDKNKAQKKADALTAYQSDQLFGGQLYGSDSNNTLLTSYHNPNASTGSFSILN
jgi:hypothetical protein